MSTNAAMQNITALSNKESFYAELDKLKLRFAAMKPELEVTVRDPDMDVEGYVVVWNTKVSQGGPFDRNGKGCGKGGTRVLPDLSLDDVKRLSRSMAEKNAAAGLHFGGAKSGLKADPEGADYEKKYRRFVQLVQESGILVEDGGIFGGFGYDVGGKPPLNAHWACDQLGTLNSFTGKPVEMGGTDYDSEGIAGLGVAVAGKTLCEHHGRNMNEISFAVQGVGAMGCAVIRYFSDYGATLKSLSDPKYGGTWLFENGADQNLYEALSNNNVDAAKALLPQQGTLQSDDPSAALYQDVDIIFPCALEDSITADNAHKISAPFMSEGANNPTTDEAHAILFENGTTVVPDIIANPGGIIAAYVELTSSISAEENLKTRGKVEEAKQTTITKVSKNVKELLSIAESLGVKPHCVGDYLAYRNIFFGIPS